MTCPTQFALKPVSTTVQDALEVSRVFTLVRLQQIISHLGNAALTLLLRQRIVNFPIHNLFGSGNESPLLPQYTATGFPLSAAQVAEFSLAITPRHFVSTVPELRQEPRRETNPTSCDSNLLSVQPSPCRRRNAATLGFWQVPMFPGERCLLDNRHGERYSCTLCKLRSRSTCTSPAGLLC